jgi:metal-responsive CopG/Arc/MetJ family transcriptional regulator
VETVKTAISIEKSLFEQVQDIAHKMHVSRSRLFVLAIEDYIRREQNREMLDQINAAYADEFDRAEQELIRRSRHQHQHIVEGEW